LLGERFSGASRVHKSKGKEIDDVIVFEGIHYRRSMNAGDSTLSTIGKLMDGRTCSRRLRDAYRRIVSQPRWGLRRSQSPGGDSGRFSDHPCGRERQTNDHASIHIYSLYAYIGADQDGARFLRDDRGPGAESRASSRDKRDHGGDRRFPPDRFGDDQLGRILASLGRRYADRWRHSLVRRIARDDRTVQPSGIAIGHAGQTPAVTPLAIPIIVTPWGVTAILIFIELADNSTTLVIVVGISLLVMLLNLVGMLLARRIIGVVGMMAFQVVGWIFAVLQAGFGVDAVVTSLRNLALFRPNS
jgi:hypothetical protein